jgi:hypothetical protein
MAKEPRPKQQTEQLKFEVARSRDRLARDVRNVRYDLDIPRKIRRSLREQTGLWIGAAVVVGTLIVLLPLRKKKVYVDVASGAQVKAKPQRKLLEAGFLLGVLRLAATLLKPQIEGFIAKKMRGYAGESRPAAKKW